MLRVTPRGLAHAGLRVLRRGERVVASRSIFNEPTGRVNNGRGGGSCVFPAVESFARADEEVK